MFAVLVNALRFTGNVSRLWFGADCVPPFDEEPAELASSPSPGSVSTEAHLPEALDELAFESSEESSVSSFEAVSSSSSKSSTIESKTSPAVHRTAVTSFPSVNFNNTCACWFSFCRDIPLFLLRRVPKWTYPGCNPILLSPLWPWPRLWTK